MSIHHILDPTASLGPAMVDASRRTYNTTIDLYLTSMAAAQIEFARSDIVRPQKAVAIARRGLALNLFSSSNLIDSSYKQ